MRRNEIKLICRRCRVEFFVTDKIVRLLRDSRAKWPRCLFGHNLTVVEVEDAVDADASAPADVTADGDEISRG
jgi:hypothetical protein